MPLACFAAFQNSSTAPQLSAFGLVNAIFLQFYAYEIGRRMADFARLQCRLSADGHRFATSSVWSVRASIAMPFLTRDTQL
jgi:hypothetical protein